MLFSALQIPMANPSVLISGFYGYHNLGDEAMLAGLIRWLRRRGERPITVLSGNPRDTQKRHRVNTFPPAPHRSKRELFRNASQSYLGTLLQHRLVILGGGDLLRDGQDYDVAGRWLKILQDAQRLGRKTAIIGVSVGEIWKPETQELIPKVLNRVDLIAVRDRSSQSKLQSLGVTQQIHLMADMALWGLPELGQPEYEHRPQSDPPQIGISLRLLSNRGQSASSIDLDDFRQQVAQVLDQLVETQNAIIQLLPFQSLTKFYLPEDDDYIAALEVLRYCRPSPRLILHRHLDSLANLKSALEPLDLLIGMRLHSLILATGLGIPTIAAAYDPKVTGFMAEINQSDRCFGLHEFTADQITPIATAILAEPAKARLTIGQNLANYQARANPFEHAFQQLLEGLR